MAKHAARTALRYGIANDLSFWPANGLLAIGLPAEGPPAAKLLPIQKFNASSSRSDDESRR
jgi:hypothetical protein